MRYNKVESCIWQDEKFKALSDNEKFLFLYLLTTPHSNSLGAFVLPSGYISADLRWKSRKANAAFSNLLTKGLIFYDKENELVVIKNYLKHNPLENPNQTKGAIKTVSQLPKSQLLQHVIKQLNKKHHKDLVLQINKQLPEPLSEQFIKQFLEQIGEPNSNSKQTNTIGTVPNTPTKNGFNFSPGDLKFIYYQEIVPLHPTQVNKVDGFDHFVEAVSDNGSINGEIIKSIKADLNRRKSEDKNWIDGFVPGLDKYFRNKVWTQPFTKKNDEGDWKSK